MAEEHRGRNSWGKIWCVCILVFVFVFVSVYTLTNTHVCECSRVCVCVFLCFCGVYMMSWNLPSRFFMIMMCLLVQPPLLCPSSTKGIHTSLEAAHPRTLWDAKRMHCTRFPLLLPLSLPRPSCTVPLNSIKHLSRSVCVCVCVCVCVFVSSLCCDSLDYDRNSKTTGGIWTTPVGMKIDLRICLPLSLSLTPCPHSSPFPLNGVDPPVRRHRRGGRGGACVPLQSSHTLHSSQILLE